MRNPDSNESKTIMIVDDNPTNLDILFDYLDTAGFEVLIAEDGESALNQLRYAQPNLILLDVMMPGIDGFETCRRLQDNTKTKDIPVIFMTALTEPENKIRGFAVGAVDYVTKPLQYKEVLARVNTHLTIQNLRQHLRRQVDELQARNEELRAFTHSVAHDLKNPLTAMISYAQLIERGTVLPPKLQKHLEELIKIGEQMSKITDELLLLARIRDTEISLQPLDMQRIVEASCARLALMFEEHKAEIIVPSEWPASFGYAPWVEQVWVNYLSNGIKYGGRPPKLELGATPQANGQLCFWVRDNGAGLDTAGKARLFTEFTRLRQAQVEGYGLGLSIVKRIVEKLGGQVGVESEPGQGSTFYFTLSTTPLSTTAKD